MNLTRNKLSKLKKKKNQSRKKFKNNKKYKHHNTYKKKKPGHIKNNTLKMFKGGADIKELFKNSKFDCKNEAAIIKFFADNGYQLGMVPKDGDCMYNAFKDSAANKALSKFMTVSKLKQDVIKYLKKVFDGEVQSNFINYDDIIAAIINDFATQTPSTNPVTIDLENKTKEQVKNYFDDYISRLNSDGYYGDQLIFSVLQNEIFKVSVEVFQCSINRKNNNEINKTVTSFPYKGKGNSTKQIYLYLNDINDSEAHYYTLQKMLPKSSSKSSTSTTAATAATAIPSTAATKPIKSTKIQKPPNLFAESSTSSTSPITVNTAQTSIGPVNIGPPPLKPPKINKLQKGDLVYYNANENNTNPRDYEPAKIVNISKNNKGESIFDLSYIDNSGQEINVNNVNANVIHAITISPVINAPTPKNPNKP